MAEIYILYKQIKIMNFTGRRSSNDIRLLLPISKTTVIDIGSD